jgi:sugar phosphate isomerase/epimerase
VEGLGCRDMSKVVDKHYRARRLSPLIRTYKLPKEMSVNKMIGLSCPGFCMTPYNEMLKKISPHFELWEIIAEGMHEMSIIQDEIRNTMDSYDIRFTLHAPFSDLNLASLNPKIRQSSIDQIEEAIRISSNLGIKIITIHPGHKSPLGAYFEEKFVKTNKKSITELDKVQEEYGVVLALENMPKMWISLCHNAQQLEDLTDGTNIKLCFDLGHANISGTISEILNLKENFVNVHLHDNNGDRDYHLILEEGNIDIQGVLKELKGYDGDYIIESTNIEEGVKSKHILEKMLKVL